MDSFIAETHVEMRQQSMSPSRSRSGSPERAGPAGGDGSGGIVREGLSAVLTGTGEA